MRTPCEDGLKKAWEETGTEQINLKAAVMYLA
jgi:hypothetical protein